MVKDVLGVLLAIALILALIHPSRLALTETIRQIEHTGARAVPIVALISFLMGLVLAHQGANQLAEFGAEVFVAEIVKGASPTSIEP